MYEDVKAVESSARTYARKFPLSVKRAEGVYMYDMNEVKYLDCLGNAGTLAFGHNHPKLREAALAFFEEGRPYQALDLTTESKHEFVTTLFSLLPPGLRENGRIQFCGPTGTDADEAAIKLCKTATGRGNILGFSGGYHGHTQGTLALMGNLGAKGIQNLMPGVHFLPYPYSYRCPFGIGGPEATTAILRYIENLLDDPESGITKPAAIILEPIQGEGGVIPAPVEFLQGLRRITLERDIPLIFDEIQCGFCRSGKIFAFQYADVEPDVLVLSKALGGGQPLACIVYHKKLDGWAPGAHAGTFRGNQLAMTLGKVSMDLMIKENICDHVLEVGQHLMDGLRAIQKEVRCIGEVRGKGLMIGVEIVDFTKSPNHLGSYPQDGDLSGLIQKLCFEKKMIIERGGRFGATVRFLPSLVITKDQIDQVLQIFSEAVKEAEATKKQ
eukprot:TRINITY_DN4289_c0_g1_i2.p1 TRINITY_DN4289_c0_g1~~TRINITY_DN4289_c0_g1_i2.p1  ORF type:complete len:441 (-),score=79.39 TRINITY_DN4289_c0_g1_i2:82-1404(-)